MHHFKRSWRSWVYLPARLRFTPGKARLSWPFSAFPGIPELLQSLTDAGVPIAVATGKSRARAIEALDSTNLTSYIDVVIGSDVVAKPKPAPDIVLLALAQLGTELAGSRRSDAMFVGDSILDMQCGRAAGVTVIAAGWGQTPLSVLISEGPDAVAATPSAVFETLGLPAWAQVV